MKYSKTKVFLMIAVTVCALVVGRAWGADARTITTATKAPYDTYLVDAEGMSLYLFKADGQSESSTCHGDCAEYWPPLLTDGSSVANGAANTDLLSTIKRDDGSTQVTYNGWPLYYFIKDKKAGDTAGQDVHGFGSDWYLVNPQGHAIDVEETNASGGSHY